MGLIDFIKDAGNSIFGSDKPSEEEVAKQAAEQLAAEYRAAAALGNSVREMKIPIDNLDVKLNGDVATITGTTTDQANAELAALVVGNNQGVRQVDNRIVVENPAPEAVYYTVVSGDSLSKIAKAQYGDPMKYTAIFDANKPMLSDPDKIYPGQVLRIPPLN